VGHYAAVISSTDRTTFFEFQARNRRATWRLTAVCSLIVGAAGIVSTAGFLFNLVLVLFALVFFPSVLLLAIGFFAGLIPVTASLRDPILGVAMFAMRGLSLASSLWPSNHPLFYIVLAVLLPTIAWLAVRSVWLAAGVGHTLLAIGAREPKPGDFEETQLVNVVEEMAIAAGIPAPQVRLLDANVANAAAVGTGPADSYVVVGRRLLDEFDRDETQGILGHLLGSIGNADLRGAAQIHAMLYVLELLTALVLAPFASFPRRIARKWLAFPIGARFQSPEKRAERARELIDLLEAHRAAMPSTENEMYNSGAGISYFGRVGRVLVRMAPPLMALVFFAKASTGFLLIFASVPVALLWRSRRYLADATGVQLTRNPTGLYRGLSHLGACGAIIPGGESVSHLFIIAPEKAGGNSSTFTQREGLLMGMHPSLEHRLARLVRMGAVPPGKP
jgi:Zn-dependent protease with chaperone function